jgi:hypothetical protein
MELLRQFKNLLDPSNALGAFLISFFAGIASSFFAGRKYQMQIEKKNRIDVSSVGEIMQDVHKRGISDSKEIKNVKENSIKAGSVTGSIKQDVEE